VVMTAILAIQSLVFQDGGILALGANVLNMAMAGVLAAYVPFHLAGGAARKPAIVLGGFLSVLVSAAMAMAELALSGVRIPAPVLGVSALLFAVSAALEGAISLAVMEALETVQPGFGYAPVRRRAWGMGALGAAAVLLAVVGVLFASAHPDGLRRLAEQAGIAGRAQSLVSSPLADYEAGFLASPWLRKAAAGMAGIGLIYLACLGVGRVMGRRRNAS